MGWFGLAELLILGLQAAGLPTAPGEIILAVAVLSSLVADRVLQPQAPSLAGVHGE